MAQALGGGVMVDHGVHGTGIKAEIKPGAAEFTEIPEVVPPVGLGHNGHPVAPLLEPPCNDSRAEGRMIYECVSGKQDYINVVPSQGFHFLYGCGEHICRFCHNEGKNTKLSQRKHHLVGPGGRFWGNDKIKRPIFL